MRSLILLLVLSFTAPTFAHQRQKQKTGWWKNFCETYLIADDPYQYDHVAVDTLLAEYRRVGAKVYWREDKDERHYLKTLADGLRKRLIYETIYGVLTDQQREAITLSLEDYPAGG